MAAPKAPKGAKSDKEWRDAIRRAVHELRVISGDKKAEKIKAMTLLARRLVTKGIEGDVSALKEIGDRLDGKATQAVQVGMDVQITHIERSIVDALPVPDDKVIEGEAVEVKDATGDGESDEDTRDTEGELTR